MIKVIPALLIILMATSCAIEFQVASQRTAIEEQILGAYQEMDQELVLMSSVRAVDNTGQVQKLDQNPLEEKATIARQNQQFNLDDIMELKTKEFIGEGLDGLLHILPKKTGRIDKATAEELNLIRIIVAEENRDRTVIWQRVIEKSPDLQPKDLDVVRRNYRNQMVESLGDGMWLQEEENKWSKKAKN